MSRKPPPAAPTTAATAALTAAGVPFTPHRYDHDPMASDFGAEAARELGVDPARVFKTIMVVTDAGGFGIGVVPVAALLDLKALAAQLGGKKAELAERAAAERKSGYVVGGISPLGQRTALPTVIDRTAQGFDTVFVSGGRRGFDLELTASDLAAVTHAVFADIRRR